MRRTLKQPKKRLDHSPRHDDRTATLITVEIFPECRSPGKAGPSGNSFAIPATRHKLFLSGNNTMRKFVAGLNIDHYREILAVETDGEKRKLIEKLLADAEAELAAAKEKDREQKAH
jgi:hypothetical protein